MTDLENTAPTETEQRRPWWRRKRVLGPVGLLAITGITVGGIYIFAAELALWGLEQAASTAPAIVKAESLQFKGTRGIVLNGVTVSDDRGVWASVPKLEIRWHPRALLDRMVDVERVAAAELTVNRLPVTASQSDSDEIVVEWPRVSFDILLKTLAVDTIKLINPDGGSYSAQLYGHFEMRNGVLSLRTEAKRTDGVEEGATITADINEFARRIAINVAATSPKGGWLSTQIAEQSGLEPGLLRAGLRGSGTPENWTGGLEVAFENVVTATADFAIVVPVIEPDGEPTETANGNRKKQQKPNDEDRDLKVTGAVTMAKPFLASFNLPPEIADRVSGPIAVDAAFAVRDRTVTTVRAAVKSDHGVTATVVTAPPWSNHQITAEISGKPFVLNAISIAGATASGVIDTSNREQLKANIDVTAKSFNADSVAAAKLDGKIDLAMGLGDKAGPLTVNGSGRLFDVTTSLDPSLRFPGPITWAADVAWDGEKILTIKKGTVQDKGLRLDAHGKIDVSSGAAEAVADFKIDDLAKLTSGRYSGQLAAHVEATPRGKGQTAWLVKATADNLDNADIPGLRALGKLTVDGNVVYGESGGDGTISIDNDAFTITANGSLSASDYVIARIEAAPKDAVALRRVLGTPIDEGSSFVADLVGPRDDLGLSMKASIPEMGTPPMYFRNLRADVRLSDLLGAVGGSFYFTGEGPLGSMRGIASVRSPASGKYDIRDIMIDTPVATFTGVLWADTGIGLLNGRIDGLSGDLALLERNLDFEATGAFTMSLFLRSRQLDESWTNLVQDIDLSIKGNNMSTVLADREAVVASLLDAELKVGVLGGLLAPRAVSEGQGKLLLEGYKSSTLSLNRLALDLTDKGRSGEAATVNWSLNILGDYFGALDVKGGGALRYDNYTLTADVNSLAGKVIDRPLNLTAPTKYVVSGEGMELSPLTLQYGQGRATFAYKANDHDMAASLKTESVELALVPIVLGLPPFTGTLDGTADLRFTDKVPSGTVALKARIIETDGAGEAIQPFTVALGGNITATNPNGSTAVLALDTRINGDNLQGRLTASVPLFTDLSQIIALDERSPLTANLTWDGGIEPFFAMLPPIDHVLAGKLTADVSMTGSANDPIFDGSFGLSNGRYEHLMYGTTLSNVTAKATLDKQTLTINELTANDGEKGKLSGSGRMTLDEDNLPLGRVTIKLDSAKVVRMNAVEADTSGTIVYARNKRAGRVTGDLTLNRVEAKIVDTLPREITTLNVREINRYGIAKFELTPEPERTSVAAISDLNLKVSAPSRVFVRGRGLDSEWGGTLTVRGTPDLPKLVGQLNLVRGTFSFAGKDFNLTQGTFRFDGADKIDPSMNLKAEFTSADLTAYMAITGTLSKPSLALTSTPSLPQDEILARILFGTSIQQLSALEAVQLASAVSGLASGGGFDLFGKARSIFGLDRLSVGSDPSGNGGNIVSGGKYISRKVYLEVQTDTDTGESKANVRIDITPSLQVEGGVGAQDNSSVGIRWKRDY